MTTLSNVQLLCYHKDQGYEWTSLTFSVALFIARDEERARTYGFDRWRIEKFIGWQRVTLAQSRTDKPGDMAAWYRQQKRGE